MEAGVGAEPPSRDKQRDYFSVLHHSLSSGWPWTDGRAKEGGWGGGGCRSGRRAVEKKKRLTHGHSHTHSTWGEGKGGERGVSLIPSKTEKLAINLFGSFSTGSPDCRLVLQHLVQDRPSGGGRARENLPLLHCFLVHRRLVWFDVKSNH